MKLQNVTNVYNVHKLGQLEQEKENVTFFSASILKKREP